MTKNILTQERLKELLHYCPETGVFTWKQRVANRIHIGDTAGCLDKCKTNGYIRILRYRAHRLAFLYMEGEMPKNDVDHINRVRNDNRWCNLRHATHRMNMNNMSSSNHFVGVAWHKGNLRWRAIAIKNNKQVHIGNFKTNIAACMARHQWNLENNAVFY